MSAGLEVADVEGTVSVNFKTFTPYAGLDLQPGDPPQARAQGQHRDPQADASAWRQVDSRSTTTA